ncbi:MAG: lytic transglycosylase domain-containing protein [Rhizobiales bacterium]|nr:lytic transglycosylase domain-containing protein [Hyphomicrobiales bacterium]
MNWATTGRSGILLISFLLLTFVFAAPRAHAGSSEQAVKLASKGKFQQAFSRAKDPVARKTVEWLYLRSQSRAAGYNRIMSFVQRNGRWPYAQTLEKQAEGHLMSGSTPLATVQAHFAKRAPLSPEGKIALARLKLATGDKKTAKRLVRDAWLDRKLSKRGERVVISTYKSLLNRGDMERRWASFIYHRKLGGAVRNANHISRDHARATRVAGQLFKRRKGALSAYRKLPSRVRNTNAMRFALTHYHRWKGDVKTARKLLLGTNQKAANFGAGDAWWVLRQRVARELLGPSNRKNWRSAYKVAAGHGFSSGRYYAQGEFLSGWIALRYLNDAKTAHNHFARIPAAAKLASERSRGHYWLARAQMALGRPAAAKKSFAAASAFPTHFYGQLSRDALGYDDRPLPLKIVTPTAADRDAVARDEVVRAFKLVSRAGAKRHQRGFLWGLSRRFSKPGQHAAVAEIIKKNAGYGNAMRYAKIARLRGFKIDNWAFPKGAMPRWKTIGHPVERALVFGLTRQESEFVSHAGSHAGAKGLMQIMPGTAKIIARKHKVRHARSKLTRNPAYNVMLGAAHLGDLLAEYRGSMVMTLAAYNAGPGNVRKWVAQHGDPRTKAIDPIDWTESIPFQETRNYVKKVLQNVQVYRTRLGQKKRRSLMADLHGGSGHTGSINSTKSTCGGAQSIASLIVRC